MPGSTEKTIPGSATAGLEALLSGGSWQSRPQPWPSRWVKKGP